MAAQGRTRKGTNRRLCCRHRRRTTMCRRCARRRDRRLPLPCLLVTCVLPSSRRRRQIAAPPSPPTIPLPSVSHHHHQCKAPQHSPPLLHERPSYTIFLPRNIPLPPLRARLPQPLQFPQVPETKFLQKPLTDVPLPYRDRCYPPFLPIRSPQNSQNFPLLALPQVRPASPTVRLSPSKKVVLSPFP